MLSENLDSPITPNKIYLPNRFGKIHRSFNYYYKYYCQLLGKNNKNCDKYLNF